MDKIDFGLAGKTAIVTGGGSRGDDIGNGRAAAIMLARAGASIALIDVVPEAADRTRRMIQAEGGAAEVFTADVSKMSDCTAAVAAVIDRFDMPLVLVNNVGVAGPPGTAVDVDPDSWDEGMKANVKSMMLMSRLVIPSMVERGSGSIVNISSSAGIVGGHPALLYATAKGAVVNLTRAMASHHGPAGVRVNCVAPGMVHTPMVVSRGMSPDMREARQRLSILQTEGTGWDVGNAVLYLASDLARWVTGVTVPVDGGYTAARTMPTPPREA